MSNQPWLKSYPPGVRWDAPLEISSVQNLLETAARRFGSLPALQFMNKRSSYAELDALANRAAAGFQRLGVRPGVHVGLYLPNTPHYVIAFFGALKAGGAIVNYSPLDALSALQYKIEDSETDILVTLDVASLYPQAERLLASTRLKRLIVGEFAEMAVAPGPVKAQMAAAGMLAEVKCDDRRIAFRELIENEGRYQAHPLGDLRDELAVIQYTGGTTGKPKGAMLTHANLSAASGQYLETATRTDPPAMREGQERTLVVLPLFHIYALSAVMILAIRLGSELVLHPRFDPLTVAKDIAEKKITVFPGVPTMYVALLNLPGIDKFDLSSLRHCGSGGASLPVAVQQRFQGLVGCRLTEGWGMSEGAPFCLNRYDGERKLLSVGNPVPETEVEVVDIETGTRVLPIGEAGEVRVRGPQMMTGYHNKPTETAYALRDGYMYTGDIGYVDNDGFLFLVDRKKEMIIVGGYNVYPREIDEVLFNHPAIREAATVGKRDDRLGEVVVAFVAVKSGAELDEERFFAYCKENLVKYKRPVEVQFIDALPRTGTNKIDRIRLKALAAKAVESDPTL